MKFSPTKDSAAHTDLHLPTIVLGNGTSAAMMLKKAGGSLFNLLHTMPHQNGDLFCAQGTSPYTPDPTMKLQAVRELATRAMAEDLKGRDCLTSPGAVRDLLRHKLAGLPHEVFVCIQLDAQH